MNADFSTSRQYLNWPATTEDDDPTPIEFLRANRDGRHDRLRRYGAETPMMASGQTLL